MKVLMLFSWTGGGHHAAARAIEAALSELEDDIRVDLVDGLVEGAGWPLKRSPELYAWCMRRARWAYAAPWYLSNGPARARWMADLGQVFAGGRLRRLLDSSDADIIVSVHPLLTRTVVRAMSTAELKRPFLVVVTDPITPHWSWFDRGVDRTLVPTPEAQDLALKGGLLQSRLVITGQVIHPSLARAIPRRSDLRLQFGWDQPVVLMLAGGDGVGRLTQHLDAVVASHPQAHLVVVCGRNEELRQDLSNRTWRESVEVHGFVENLGELMAAADILVTKAGPGSVMEGCVTGLPILLYDRLPGQEVGNVRMVEERGIGLFVPRPADLVRALEHWLKDPQARAQAAAAALSAGVADSARHIAREIVAAVRAERGSEHC